MNNVILMRPVFKEQINFALKNCSLQLNAITCERS